MPDGTLLGDLVAIVAAVCWAGTTILTRHLSRRVAPAWCNTFRWIFGFLLVLPIVPFLLGGMRFETIDGRAILLLALSVISGMGIGDTAFFIAMKRVGVSRAMPIAGTNPLITAVFAVVLFGEALSWVRLAGILLVGVSIWILMGEQAPATQAVSRRDAVVGYGLAALAAFGWAGSGLLVQPVVQTMDVLLATAIRIPMAVAFMVAAMAVTGSRVARPTLDRRLTLLLALLGGLTIASTTIYLAAVAIIGAARTTAVTSVTPLLSALLAVWLLGERVTPRLVVSLLIVVVGLAAVVLG